MDAHLFSDKVCRCTDKLWRIGWSILQNGADCDDALQNTLLRAWRNLDSLRQEAYFETWLTRIMINECKNLLRRRKRQAVALPEVLPGPADVPENKALAEAIAMLPLNYRLPLVLHYMEGYSIAEIARMLKLPETTVKSRMYAARKKIRSEWTK